MVSEEASNQTQMQAVAMVSAKESVLCREHALMTRPENSHVISRLQSTGLLAVPSSTASGMKIGVITGTQIALGPLRNRFKSLQQDDIETWRGCDH
jgi:hypothetical protein